MRLALVTRVMLDALAFASLITFAFAAEPLAGTAPLDWPEEDLSGRMMDGAHRFVEQQIAQAREKRQKFWPASALPSDETFDANRKHLREIIGVVDPRLPPRLERFGA